MSKNTSHLVWAKRFNLLELKSQREGTYNQNGSRELKGEGMVVRSFAVARNAQLNNEIYVFDEEKTDELLLLREENIKKQAEEKEKKTVSSEDAGANAMVKALYEFNSAKESEELAKLKAENKALKEGTSDESKPVDTLEDLKTIIKENDLGIRISKTDTRKTVEAKIKEAQK